MEAAHPGTLATLGIDPAAGDAVPEQRVLLEATHGRIA